jgi:hypothetical protein
MKFELEVENRDKRWDAIGTGNGRVATVELKTRSGRVVSDWWISGLNAQNELVALVRCSFGLGHLTEREALSSLSSIYEEILERPLTKLAELGGFLEAPNTGSSENKLALCLVHLDYHERLGNIGESVSIREDIARQFQLIKSFGYSTAQKLIAERTGLPRSTVDRRLFLARESGLLPKMSDSEDINK